MLSSVSGAFPAYTVSVTSLKIRALFVTLKLPHVGGFLFLSLLLLLLLFFFFATPKTCRSSPGPRD